MTQDQGTLQLQERMSRIKHKIAVISGKGGVGKSLVTANLAVALSLNERNIGILDADIHGPCIPKLLALKGEHMDAGPAGIMPVVSRGGIRCASMAFLLPSDDAPVIWRGPLKMGAIKQLLGEVMWGDLDYLLVDLPPGTGDEPLSALQLIPDITGVLIITIPSEVSGDVVRKAVTFARQLNVTILGIVENMSGLICPHCKHEIKIFEGNAGKKVAEDMGIPFLGSIPLDPRIANDSDQGTPFIAEHRKTIAAKSFQKIVDKIVEEVEK